MALLETTRNNGAPGARPAAFRLPRPWLLLCLVLVFASASYLPVLGAPFIWDDRHLVEESPLVQERHPLPDYFRQAFWQRDELGRGRTFYRPLVILSLAIDHSSYGDAAGGYHLSNLLAHLLSTVLLFRLLCVRGATGVAAAIGAALWSLHPRLTEAVAWISGRTDVLATCFVLAALLVQSRPGQVRRFVCGALLFLGLLCKEVALAGVGAVLVFELMPTASWLARAWRALPALLALAGYALLRALASGVATPGALSLGKLLLRALAAIGQYVVMFVTPWFPNAQIGQLSQPNLVLATLGCVALLALCGLLVRFRRLLDRAVWSALTLTALGLGMVLHIVPFSSNVVAADRFLYLPLAGVALLLAPNLAMRGHGSARFSAATFGLLALSFAVATFVRAEAWADEVTLWSSTFSDSPDNQHVACAQLGRLYMRAGLLAHALSLYRGCVVTPSSRFIMLSNGASVLARAGRYREAQALLDDLPASARQQPLVLLNSAFFQTYLGDFGSARGALTRALKVDPSSSKALALSRQLPSIERARQQLDTLPSNAPALERARLLQSLGLTAQSSRAWQLAFESSSLSPEQFREGLAFVVGQADAETLEALHRQYPAQFAPAESSQLAHEYTARHELSLRLRAAWPGLHVQLRALPGTLGS